MLNIQFLITRVASTFIFSLFVFISSAQTIKEKLQTAYQQFEADSQMRHAISSLYIINAKTGEVVFDKNSQIGLAGASTQKIITAATAFELLGKDYKYKTEIGFEKKDKAVLGIMPSGDPTFGSWRWDSTKEEKILNEIVSNIVKSKIKEFSGINVIPGFKESETIPDGWIWQDIGNYYGAGSGILNWRENQFDLILKSGKNIGDPVSIVATYPKL